MQAVILLSTNPGHQEQAYGVLDGVLDKWRAKSGTQLSVVHCFGRYDGVLLCEFDEQSSANKLAEELRRDGTFHTETLIGV